MKVIGITGASGSGKTTISDILKVRNDIKILNADKMAKELTNQGSEYFMEIKRVFSDEEIILEDGSLNRPKLAKLICDNKENLSKLNNITLKFLIPQIVDEIKNVTDNIKIVIIDAPLLFEFGLDKYCDFIVTLCVPDELKVRRICKRDNISRQKAQDRLNIQNTNEFYERKSDYVITNDENTTIENLKIQINTIIDEILK